ncbi:MAG: tRNA (adenosine(37)-N6)-threonylcarbamoyltransferase complex ATPase subunit type 1 TsaE [Geminicoccaceae bacterium]|nr:MAG: tRNA (adenosine(37)-N6)-threonylcarbamoyltransferase complex ATPase subunit type 1 TsaE [Geminicoccaceae bacterium]
MILLGEAATAAFGQRLASLLRPGDVVTLEGDLGAGKSTLARACIQALAGAPIEVPSPTFTLVQVYDLPAFALWHVDLYRLGEPAEVDELGLDEAAFGVLLIEWPDRLPRGSFPERLHLRLEAVDADRRGLSVEAGPAWQARAHKLA